MAIMLLSIVSAMVLGCTLWLVIGDRFPLKEEDKFPALNNISIYVALLVVPTYLLIFVLF